MPGRVIWCLGMYASASTWAFNAVRQIAEAGGQATPKIYFFGGDDGFSGFDQSNITNIVKSHEIDKEDTLLGVSGRAGKIIVTVRDPRDAVTSLMLSHGYAFDRALHYVEHSARLCMGFARDKRALLLRYESLFFDDPATVQHIAAHLDYSLAEKSLAEIHQQLSRASVEKFIRTMPSLPNVLQDRISGDLLDPQTQWHSHHAGRTGEVGRWRNLLPAPQVKLVQERLRDVPGVFSQTS